MRKSHRPYGSTSWKVCTPHRWISSSAIWSACVILLIFVLPTCQPIELEGLPYIVTDDPLTTDYGSYRFMGAIVYIGENQVKQHGFCWSTSNYPDLSNESVKLGIRNQPGIIYTDLPHLSGNTTYYIRTYLTTASGTIFGNQITYRTPMSTIPVLSTSIIQDSTEHIVKSGGEVLFSGGKAIHSRGICWSTQQNVSISDSVSLDGSGTGSFVSLAVGLTPNTTYYLRAYATNSIGTGYGEVLSHTTWAGGEKFGVSVRCVKDD